MPALWRLTTRTAASTCRFSRPRLSESQFQDQDQLTPSLFLYSMPILLAATLMTQYLENRVDSKLPSDARRLISAARASNLLSSAAWVMLTWKLNRLIAHYHGVCPLGKNHYSASLYSPPPVPPTPITAMPVSRVCQARPTPPATMWMARFTTPA